MPNRKYQFVGTYFFGSSFQREVKIYIRLCRFLDKSIEYFCNPTVSKGWNRNIELQNAHLLHLSKKVHCCHGIHSSSHPLFGGRQANWGDVANILSFITLNGLEKRAALRPAELCLAELKLPGFIAGHYSPWPLEKEEGSVENIQRGSVRTGVMVTVYCISCPHYLFCFSQS